jgi:hypothetical protein
MQFEIFLNIDELELEKYYRGTRTVSAKSIDGRRVQFPVNILHKYITHDGIRGRFVLEYDQQFKFKNIHKL